MYTLRVINKKRDGEKNFLLGNYYEILNPMSDVFKTEFKESDYPPEVSCMVRYYNERQMHYSCIEIEEGEHAYIVNESGKTHRRINTVLDDLSRGVRDEMVKNYLEALS